MMKHLLLPLALVATLSSTGCTLGGVLAAARDTQDPTREAHPVLDVVTGIALDALLIGTVVCVAKNVGPWDSSYTGER